MNLYLDERIKGILIRVPQQDWKNNLRLYIYIYAGSHCQYFFSQKDFSDLGQCLHRLS